ncbi:Protein kinase-like domain [Cordyceps militaris CM01]|uniref:EKC/KEOPS complex subunit BUD32 n=1 Tax=Cordyceps militaris (strain CM01) TaxID=983644 RepID=G3JTJ2_CORMM|nr:Protein kinase-like domain [Cordyceps militaris CM01]EGX87996.1 Protein kinase-like domain [Cordyceps militaris CM01]
MTSSNQTRAEVIRDYPIANGLDAFRSTHRGLLASLQSTSGAAAANLSCEDIQSAILALSSALLPLPASRRLPSGRGYIRKDILHLLFVISCDHFDFDRTKPLLEAALDHNSLDSQIWDLVTAAALESTPPRTITSSLQQTPWKNSTGGFANSSEYRKDIDRVLKRELGPLHVGLPGFHDAFFGGVKGLSQAADIVFQRCTSGDTPLFLEGWNGWPENANQDDVLAWLKEIIQKLAAKADDLDLPPAIRRPLAVPKRPIQGSTSERKLDIGFISDPKADENARCHWSQIQIAGELKSNPSADTTAKAWLDIGRYAREVLASQDTRRFVLAFTLCGPLMRIWVFDRLGGISSERFNINEDGRQFVATILGFIQMSDKDLGHDPTIIKEGTQRYIDIERNGKKERIFIQKVIRRARCLAGRATTCWKAYSDLDPATPLVVKDAWQYPERADEGEMLRYVTEKGVVNVARYYHHTTVFVDGTVDDVSTNVRHGLNLFANVSSPLRRTYSASPTESSLLGPGQNRVHRRLILHDCGKPIYEASSRKTLLMAFEQCLEGYESLLNEGILHRDISINNLLISDDERHAFIIDLDLAIKLPRLAASGAKVRAGTRAFMAIGALLGDEHSFMHDLESFFWVLFWICIHYDGPGKDRGPSEFESWNYEKDDVLARSKLGTVACH